MGLAELKISFTEEKRKVLNGTSIGVVLLILKDSKISGLYEYESVDGVSEKYESKNLEYIKDSFVGNVQDIRVGGSLEERSYTPSKVIVYSISGSDTLDKALESLEDTEFNYMCMPDAVDETDSEKLITFINETLKNVGYGASLVLSTSKKCNLSNVINFAMDDMVVGKTTLKSKDLLATICGICAGTPITQSITYAAVNKLDVVDKKSNNELNTLIDDGNLVLIKKGGKVRIARGVTTLTTTTGDEKESFKKIKLVRTYNFIKNTIHNVISNYYVGKVQNTYDNKVLLMSEISNFLEELSRDGVLDKGFSVDIDIEANKNYLKEIGVDYRSLTTQELKEVNTGSKVYIAIRLKAIDAMEDFNINVTV